MALYSRTGMNCQLDCPAQKAELEAEPEAKPEVEPEDELNHYLVAAYLA
jgi:hypothetical protein